VTPPSLEHPSLLPAGFSFLRLRESRRHLVQLRSRRRLKPKHVLLDSLVGQGAGETDAAYNLTVLPYSLVLTVPPDMELSGRREGPRGLVVRDGGVEAKEHAHEESTVRSCRQHE
jgi:hypothetical protein